jgi:hypothetical protein
MLASGAIVATSVPFLSKMLSTFMTVSPCIPAERGRWLYIVGATQDYSLICEQREWAYYYYYFVSAC